MLVLARHAGESIVIGNGIIKVKVLRIKGDSVRIAIEAPKDIAIDREEVHKLKSESK